MLLLWNIILLRFFRVFGLTLFGFIGFLFIFQLQELATLATSGTQGLDLFLFALLQIPYILPVAIPVSALLSAVLLFTKLSREGELTALRANGLSLIDILKPLFWIGMLFAVFNFLLTSEIATRAHLKSRQLLFEITTSNPLFLIENNRISKAQEGFISVEKIKRGERAKNLILAQVSPGAHRLALFLAQTISLQDKRLRLEDATLLFPLDKKDLYLESIERCEGEAEEWASLFRPQGWKLALDHLPFRLLICEIKYLKSTNNSEKRLSKSYAEIARRFSFALAPLSFLFAGAAFGIEVGREKRVRPYAILAMLASITLITFFIGKALDHHALLAALLFFLPHLILGAIAIFRLSIIQRGRYVAF